MQTIDANGTRIAYTTAGENGPKVVLIHGLGGSADATYGDVIDRLSSEFQVLAFDNRGVGGSAVPDGPYALADFARDAYALMRAAGFDRAHVVGHSLGGMIAEQLAVDHPDAVLSLVIADAPGTLAEGARASFRSRADTVEQGGAAAIVEGVLANGIGTQAKERRPQAVEKFKRSLLESDARAYAASCRAAADLDLLTRLQAYQGPVLVVRGEQDSGVPLEAAQTLARAFANGRFEAIPGSGHNSPFENPEVFAELVLQFVRESEGALQR